MRLIKRINKRRAKLPSLGKILQRIHLTVALVAVGMAGIFITLVAIFSLRVYADHNLHLIARSISYTTEAAVVFGDNIAASESLALIAASEEVAEAKIVDANGKLIASWSLPAHGPFHKLEQSVAHWALSGPVELPIMHNGERIGTIIMVGHGGSLLSFLLRGVIAMLAGIIASTLVALFLSRRMLRRIVGSLNRITEVAHDVSLHRSFGQRVPSVHIKELNELSNDFNGLLEELEIWQAHLTQENDFLTHRATHDSLTGLANRAFFEVSLNRTLNECADKDMVALMFLDADNFKEINDNYGHAAGDVVLITMAERIRSQLRETDFVARLGGDEFAVLLTSIGNSYDVLSIADNIIHCMAHPITLPDGTDITTSISIGIAFYPEHAQTPVELLQRADEAMYLAKNNYHGGGRVILPQSLTHTA
ncbi:diguanylate cyclase [Yersinia nurmii]|uniref:diguanylate cyclase n=1 Tax=Yersinia nurmii TaxID=685706 RepID=A0AAW7K6E3_9GAMM|nr:diguanylate cyclase [Yersinia nurmii]MDN0088227.1 diguanylate cyclase [Yersinia nurmii]CNE72637.1 inner membrane protein YfiN [Yersinia nurmii]